MINEMENKTSLDTMSDLEFDKNKVEMMRYRVNGLSYKIGLIGILCSLFAAFVCLNSTNPITVAVIIKIMLNIVILLGGFLFVEKAKNYSKDGSIGLIVMGGLCAARIFWIPMQLMINYSKYLTAYNNYQSAVASGDTAAAESAKQAQNAASQFLGKTITGYFDNGSVRWLPYSGNFRAILAIVLLAVAAVSFIYAGIIGYQRSRKLTIYLDSIKQEK